LSVILEGVVAKKKGKRRDWRSLPRKPAAAKRSKGILVKLTEMEDELLREGAAAAGLSVADYVRTRALAPCIAARADREVRESP